MVESRIRRNEHIAVKKEGKAVDDKSWRLLVPLTPCVRCSVVFPLWSSRHEDVRWKSQSAKHRNAWVDERRGSLCENCSESCGLSRFPVDISADYYFIWQLALLITRTVYRDGWHRSDCRYSKSAVSRGCTWSSQLLGDSPLGMRVWVDWIRRCWYVTV